MNETVMILVRFTLLLSACDTQEPQGAVTTESSMGDGAAVSPAGAGAHDGFAGSIG